MFIFARIKKYFFISRIISGCWIWSVEILYTYSRNNSCLCRKRPKAEMAQAETQAALEQTIKDLEQVQQQFNQVSKEFEGPGRVKGLETKLKEHDLAFLAENKPD